MSSAGTENLKIQLTADNGFGSWLLLLRTHCSSSALPPVWTSVLTAQRSCTIRFGCLENLHLSVTLHDSEICSLFFFTCCCGHKCSSNICSLLSVVTVPKSTVWQIHSVINLKDYYGTIKLPSDDYVRAIDKLWWFLHVFSVGQLYALDCCCKELRNSQKKCIWIN